MATASHEHLSDLSASLSKSHHRAPITDLWGPSLGAKSRVAEPAADYALDIARDTSRGPLMSSASSAHDSLSIEDGHTAAVHASAVHAPGVHASGVHAAGAHAPGHAVQGPTRGHGIGKDAAASPAPLTAASALWPTSSPVAGGVAMPGMPLTAAVNGASVRPVGGSVGSSSGIWGPRQSFSGFTAATSFVPAATSGASTAPYSGAGASWATMDNAAASAQPLGIHGISPSVSAPVPPVAPTYFAPAGSAASISSNTPVGSATSMGSSHMSSASVSSLGSASMQKIMTPPRSSPSPPHAATVPAMGSRLYQPPAQPQGPAHGPHGPVQAHGSHGQSHGSHGPAHASHGQQQSHQHNHGGSQMMVRGQYPNDNAAFVRPFKKNGRPSTNTELYKTELCASYMSTGGNCPYGEKCQFAHGPQELKTVDRPPKWRSKPCQNWVRTGTCSYNERCCFRHDVPIGYDQQQ